MSLHCLYIKDDIDKIIFGFYKLTKEGLNNE